MTIARPRARLATGGGGGGALGAVSSGFGGGDLDLLSAGVHRLVVDLDVGSGHDRVELLVSHLSSLADTEMGTELQVGLGIDGDPVDLLAVDVVSVSDTPSGRRLVGLAPSHRLADLRLARTYVQQSVGDVVNDLLAEAEVSAGVVDGAQSLAQYHIDWRRSAWYNLHLLADLFGAEVTSEPDGAVSFRPAPGASSGGLGGALGAAASAASSVAAAVGVAGDGGIRKGANIVAWASGDRRAKAEPVPQVAPLGAASPFGTPRGHHVLKAPDSSSGPTIVSPSLRDTDSADIAARALVARADRRCRGGRFVVVGDPSLRAGTDVSIDGDSWHAVVVRHRVDPVGGYVCELTVEATA